MTTTPGDSKGGNQYFIQDSEAELARLVEQERVISRATGGLLPEHADQAAFVEPMQRALDVACGSGGWVLEMARAYPHLQVIGFDIDANMIDYARTQAQVGQLENASFAVMNALDPLEYPDNFFDLVSGRFLVVLGRDAWPPLMQELFRITRPGGFIRVTEVEDDSVTTSPAFERMMALFLQACRDASITFSPTGRSTGLPPLLPRFLRTAGFQHIAKHASIIDWSRGTDVYAPVSADLQIFFQLARPLLTGVGVATEQELDQLSQEIEGELRADDFCAFWTFYTIWGQKPLYI